MKKYFGRNIKIYVKNNLLIQAVLINVCVFFLFQVFFNPYFETNDDNYISAILYGVYGHYDTHLVYMNVIMGKIIKFFLLIFPQLPWYTIIQYGVLWVAFTAITYLTLKEKETKTGYFLSWIVLIFFGYECYVKIQYSKTAGVVTIAGILLIYTGLKQKKIKKIETLLGIILTLVGSLYRFEVFFMVLPIIGIMVLGYAITCIRNKKYSIFFRFCAVYIPVFLICILFKLYDASIYNGTIEWKEYKSFDEDRIELLDYGFPDYDSNKDVYQELGVSKVDLDLFMTWNYADTEIFTEELLEKLAEAKTQASIDKELITGFLAKFPVSYITYTYFIVFITLFVFWLVGKKNNKLVVVSAIAIGIAIEFYFYFTNRYFINRIDMSIIMSVIIVLLYQIEPINIKSSGIAIISLILTVPFLHNAVQGMGVDSKTAEKSKEIYEIIEQDKENLYLAENATNDNLWTAAFSVWDLPGKGISENYCTLGGWRYNTPLTNYVLQSYDIENPYRDVVDNPNVYIINDNDNIWTMLKYIQEHYCSTAKLRLEKVINGHKFYKVYSQDLTLDTKRAQKFGKDIEYKFSIGDDDSGNSILQGYAYKKGTKSIGQKIYIEKYDQTTQEEIIYPAISTKKSSKDDLEKGRYSWFMYSLADMGISDIANEKINIYLEVNDELYVHELEIK